MIAALILQHQRAADRAGGATMGGFLLRRGQTTTFQERLDITERAAAGWSGPEIAAALGCSIWTVRLSETFTKKGGTTYRDSTV